MNSTLLFLSLSPPAFVIHQSNLINIQRILFHVPYLINDVRVFTYIYTFTSLVGPCRLLSHHVLGRRNTFVNGAAHTTLIYCFYC